MPRCDGNRNPVADIEKRFGKGGAYLAPPVQHMTPTPASTIGCKNLSLRPEHCAIHVSERKDGGPAYRGRQSWQTARGWQAAVPCAVYLGLSGAGVLVLILIPTKLRNFHANLVNFFRDKGLDWAQRNEYRAIVKIADTC